MRFKLTRILLLSPFQLHNRSASKCPPEATLWTTEATLVLGSAVIFVSLDITTGQQRSGIFTCCPDRAGSRPNGHPEIATAPLIALVVQLTADKVGGISQTSIN